MSEPIFPESFLWGAATSAYQIEGQPLADGAGPSIWHRFAHNPGRIANGDSGDLACDHYHRYRDDIALMSELGLGVYRFSIAWGRVLPEGRGRVNQPGLDFYRRLIDTLLEHGIQPMPTLYHWDLPCALYDRGGWLAPDSPGWFADYAELVFRALDDRVPIWITLNEPWITAMLGHLDGSLAPGHRDLFEAPQVAHHQLLAHAAAVAVYRGVGRHQIGIALNLEPQHPATPSDADRAAATRQDLILNRWFLDAVLCGRYPDELPGLFGPAWPEGAELELVGAGIQTDFVGVNYYSRGLVSAAHQAPAPYVSRVPPDPSRVTAMGWEIHPPGLTEILCRLKDDYGNPPVYVTENGAAFADPPPLDGEIADPERIDYLRTHIRAAHDALRAGVDLRGYLVWSLLDNFEWAEGYAKRFGIIGVDHQTQQRIPKQSARFYREVIRSRGASLVPGA